MRSMERRLKEINFSQVEPGNLKLAREAWAEYRVRNKWGAVAPLLSPPSSNMKLAKGKTSYGLSLAPDKSSEEYNVCPHSTPVCRAGCIAYAGNGLYPRVMQARMLKTRFLGDCPVSFVTILDHEISNPHVQAVRLNVFSDIKWEEHVPWLFEKHEDVQFYDYTKHPLRETPANYHLTYSASEKTGFDEILVHVGAGRNVAVVFDTPRSKPLPVWWNGLLVIDGDESDARYDDPKCVIVGLRAKGSMRHNGGAMVKGVT